MKTLIVVAFIFIQIFTYDAKLSYDLCVMSDITFDDSVNINNWNCTFCKNYEAADVTAFNNKTLEIQGFTAYLKQRNAIVIAFRGSDDIKNWILDFTASQVIYI
jgi:hypothetical protein